MDLDFHNHTTKSIGIWNNMDATMREHDFSAHKLNTSFQNLENYSEESELLLHMGQRRRDMTSVIFLLIVYCLIFVSGTIGNVCTCIVIVRNKYMHTATNFYLFSLAISDVLMLVFGLPFEAYSIWEAYPYRFGEFFCIFKAFLTETTSYASVITIAAFTIERYIAICFPLISHRMTDLRRSAKIIVFIWVFAAICAIPYPIHTRTFYFITNPYTKEPIKDSYMCNIPREWHSWMKYMFQISTFIFFVLPMTLITVLYILIAVTLHRTSLIRANSEDSSKGGHPSHSMKSVLRMLVAVVVAFFFCWAPFHVQRLYTLYNKTWTKYSLEVQSHLFYISGVLYFVSSTVNPILYNVMSKRYRQAFRETLCCCFSRRTTKYERSLVYYYNMKSPMNLKLHRRKTTREYRVSQFEHSNSSINNGYPVSNNMVSEIPNCPSSVKLLVEPTVDNVQVDKTNGYTKLRNNDVYFPTSFSDICQPLSKNDMTLLKNSFLSKSDNLETMSSAKNNTFKVSSYKDNIDSCANV
ncbi:hypothetical protein FSP39_009697 [Pinctada imbricata]|uniref:G-protein coupled receptors family 1 profile domain-containing protein n=1 Tax=Pinctada imbricata TaxID=66713 RepID=A0AA88Y335_PINIB|nr:hypothetical protein FSP39_009697 [Pinctada imbricata]